MENEPVSLEPRDLLLIRRDEWFDYRNDGEQTARLILIDIPPFDLQCEEFRESRTHGGIEMNDNTPPLPARHGLASTRIGAQGPTKRP